MATHNHSVGKTGKKRTHDESSTLSTNPSKKLKASGLDFAERHERRSPRSKSSASQDVVGSAPKAVDGVQKTGKESRNRSKNTTSKTADHVERRELKRQEKREQKKVNKSLAKKRRNSEALREQFYEPKEFAELAQPRRTWSASATSGGCFLPHDSKFVQDAEGRRYLLSATRQEVQLCSIADSLLVRSYAAPEGRSVSCFAVDAASDTLVHIAHDNGSVSVWDWSNHSAATESKELGANVLGMASGLQRHDKTSSLFSVSHMGTKFGIFNEGRLLFTTEHPMQSIQVIGRGEYVVCHGRSALVLGTRKRDSTVDFTWIEIPLTSTSTCVDFRVLPPRKGSEKSSKSRSGLSVAIGFADGRIQLHSDMSLLFDKSEIPPPRTLHWHRQAVSTAKFSPDGNYLISGGTETVLVLWQLETGHRQYSPHLKAAIDRIVTNSEGNQYALQMGDHSIMVLNSSDFKAVAYFAKLQTICPMEYTGESSALPRMSAVLHPRDANQVLVAVPSTQPRSDRDVIARPFLQTFDTFKSSHIRLQALQRNFTTEVAVAPDGSPLVPPDVTHLAISNDGAWLATVDDWVPAASDLEHLARDSDNLVEEQQKRREVYLRFWTWDQTRVAWIEKYTRESPHSRMNGEDVGSGKVLALASDPVSNSFATIGEDGCVKIWSTRRDMHSDSPKWKCQHSTELPYARNFSNMLHETTPQENSVWHLAYSSDGSLLSVAYSKPLMAMSGAPNEIYFINTSNGEIHSFKSGRTGGDIRGLAFLGRYYIALSTRAVYVWDFVDDRLMYKVKISSGRGDLTAQSNIQLAANQDGVTFAVLVDNKIVVYDPRQNKRLYKQEFDKNIQSVLTSRSSMGYTLILDDNTITIISPSWSSQTGIRSVIDNLPTFSTSLEVIPNAGTEASEATQAADLVASVRNQGVTRQGNVEEEDDRPVVTPQRLAEICDPKADGTLPSIYDMFWGVVRMCARKPLVDA